jgi:hypothetical protein
VKLAETTSYPLPTLAEAEAIQAFHQRELDSVQADLEAHAKGVIHLDPAELTAYREKAGLWAAKLRESSCFLEGNPEDGSFGLRHYREVKESLDLWKALWTGQGHVSKKRTTCVKLFAKPKVRAVSKPTSGTSNIQPLRN